METLWGVDGQPNDVSLGCNPQTGGNVTFCYQKMPLVSIRASGCQSLNTFWWDALRSHLATSKSGSKPYKTPWDRCCADFQAFSVGILRPGSWWITCICRTWWTHWSGGNLDRWWQWVVSGRPLSRMLLQRGDRKPKRSWESHSCQEFPGWKWMKVDCTGWMYFFFQLPR